MDGFLLLPCPSAQHALLEKQAPPHPLPWHSVYNTPVFPHLILDVPRLGTNRPSNNFTMPISVRCLPPRLQ